MVFYFISFLLFLYAYAIGSDFLVNGSLVLILATFLLKTIKTQNVLKIVNPIFFFAGGKLVTSIGNMLGSYYQFDTFEKWKYWYYANGNYLFDASLINFFNSTFLLLGYTLLTSPDFGRNLTLNYQLNKEIFYKYDRIILVYVFITIFNIGPIPQLGKINELTIFLILFVYSYLSQQEEKGSFFFLRAYVVLILMTISAFISSYLRLGLINPSILFLIGIIWGKGNFGVLKNRLLYPIYIFALIFFISFNQLSLVRGSFDGKLAVFETAITGLFDNFLFTDDPTTESEVFDPNDTYANKSIFGRLANFNQITKIVEVQRQDGFYNGETLAYLLYAWIPRVVWPSKPEIASGKWFAIRSGLAYVDENGRVNNSVDMGIGGELYLNFGYMGVIIGSFLLGIFWTSLWKIANFYDGLNLPGIMFGAYLLMLGYWQFGADMQTVITAISVYISILVGNKFLNLLTSSKS